MPEGSKYPTSSTLRIWVVGTGINSCAGFEKYMISVLGTCTPMDISKPYNKAETQPRAGTMYVLHHSKYISIIGPEPWVLLLFPNPQATNPDP